MFGECKTNQMRNFRLVYLFYFYFSSDMVTRRNGGGEIR
jgi:hypothetical protein